MNIVIAIASVVAKEMYRRKDFYVLFVLTALITLLAGSVNFFGDAKIAMYVKEICLLLIWVSSLVIAVGPAARQIPESPTLVRDHAGWLRRQDQTPNALAKPIR